MELKQGCFHYETLQILKRIDKDQKRKTKQRKEEEETAAAESGGIEKENWGSCQAFARMYVNRRNKNCDHIMHELKKH